jgi:hypothetical protein
MIDNDVSPHELQYLGGTGACWECGEEAPWVCDTPGCDRWVCYDHTIVEAQAWDVHGFDGVDIRCREHISRSFETRDLQCGQYLPPPPMKGGDGV